MATESDLRHVWAYLNGNPKEFEEHKAMCLKIYEDCHAKISSMWPRFSSATLWREIAQHCNVMMGGR
jgi:hypothetical protein